VSCLQFNPASAQALVETLRKVELQCLLLILCLRSSYVAHAAESIVKPLAFVLSYELLKILV
jgi:hypothetical protein